MVLRGVARRPQPEHRARPVLQHQHREPDVRIHARREPEGVPHGMDAERRRTDHVAGLGEEQDRRLRRLPVVLQSGPRRVLLARGLRPPVQPLARAVVPDHLDVAGLEPAAARGRVLEHARPVALSVARGRRVRIGAGGGPPPGADDRLPVERPALLLGSHQEAPLLGAGLAVLRHRLARLQGRVPIGARHLRVPAGHPRRRVVPPPERVAEPDYPARNVRRRPPEGAPDPPGNLRPGSVDAAPA